MVSKSRQGKMWSRYRCKCQAVNAAFCLCSNVEKKADLKMSDLRGQYDLFCTERHMIKTRMPDFRRMIFGERVFDGRRFWMEGSDSNG